MPKNRSNDNCDTTVSGSICFLWGGPAAMWRRCGIFPAAGSNFHILFEQIPYLRVDGLLPLRPVRDLQAIDIVQHGFLREHRGHGDEGALVGGQAADYVQFTPEHSKIPRQLDPGLPCGRRPWYPSDSRPWQSRYPWHRASAW